jgi:hypothetical protein
MKQFFRVITLLLLVTGWTVSAASVYVIRTPESNFPTIVLKNQFGFKDTYADTRSWTLQEDREHEALVSRLLQLGKSSVLAHTVNLKGGPVAAQLAAAVAFPTTDGGNGVTAKAGDVLKNVSDNVKAKLN